MSGGGARLCGRDAELAELDAAAARAIETTQFVVVSGDAGMGKSRLVAEWARRFRAGGGTPCFGYCFDFVGQPPPLAPMLAALRDVLAELSPPARERVVADAGPAELGALLPELRSVDHGVTPAPSSDHVYDTVLRTLRAAARELRLAIVLEDVHWSDALTFDVLANLVHSLRAVPLLVVVTRRGFAGAETCVPDRAIAEMSRLDHATTLALQPLRAEAIEQQLTGLMTSAPERAVVDAIVRRSGGNPFFVEELGLAHELGLACLPERLVESLDARLRRLSPAALAIVSACASYSGAMHHELIAAACDAGNDDIAIALREALGNGIVVESGGGYQVRHDLFREVATRSDLPYDRTCRHRRIATALAARPELCLEGPHAEPALVARHWRYAGDRRAAFAASLRAAETAEHLCAYGDAFEQLAYAVAEWDDVDDARELAGCEEFELCRRAARAATAAARWREGRDMFERALDSFPAHGPDDERAALIAHFADAERDFGGASASQKMFEQAEVLAERCAPSAAICDALTHLAKSRICQSRLREGADLAQRAVAIARRLQLGDELADALVCLAAALGFAGDSRRSHAATAEATDLARRSGNRQLEFWARFTDVTVHNTEEHFDEAIALAHVLLDDIETGRGGPLPRIRVLGILGEIYANTGDVEQLDRTVEQVREFRYRPWDRDARVGSLRLMLARGELDAGAREAQQLVDELDESPEPWHAVTVLQLQAEIDRWRGDTNAARRAIDRCLRLALDADDRMYRRETLLEALRIEATIATDSRRGRDRRAQEGAAKRATTMVSHATACNDADRRYLSAVEAYAERATGTGDADRFAAVAAAFACAPRALDALQMQMVEAEIALETEDRTRAKRVLLDAYGRAVDGGAKLLASRIEQLAHRARIPLTAPVHDAAEGAGLTARERDVIDGLERGLTNRQIGDMLFVSPRTVATHVSSILAKLGATTRGEAVALARDAGLLG